MMAAPFVLVFSYVIFAVIFLVPIAIFNFISMRLYKEKAKTIHPLWCLVLSFIVLMVFGVIALTRFDGTLT
jgi:hypothetical protein